MEPWTGGEQVRHLDSSTHHLFEVVQQHQQLLLLQPLHQPLQQRLTSRLSDVERLSDGRNDQGGVAYWSQVHEKHPVGEAVGEISRHLQTQTRFAHTTRTSQDHEAYVLAL